jgi:hypothetical protein
MGAVAKSYMRRGFLIYEEAVIHIWLCNRYILDFLIYEENLVYGPCRLGGLAPSLTERIACLAIEIIF